MVEAFLGPLASDLFRSGVAVSLDAAVLTEMDVDSEHADARQSIRSAVDSARQRIGSPGSRLSLVLGVAGSGKSHVLVTTLRRLVMDPHAPLFPAILQFSAPVARETYDEWLLYALTAQLAARHFADPDGRTPLRRIADVILRALSDADRDTFDGLVADGDTDALSDLAVRAAKRTRAEAATRMHEAPPPAEFIASVVLAGFGDDAALSYLRTGDADARMLALGVRAAKDAQQRVNLIIALGRTIEMVGGTLVVAFDQLENAARLSNGELLVHAVVQAVRLTESMCACAVVLCAHLDAWDLHVRQNVAQSDIDRIEWEAPRRVLLADPVEGFVRSVLGRRLMLLAKRARLEFTEGSLDPLPDWLIANILAEEGRSIRNAIRAVSAFREESLQLGKLAGPHKPPPPPPPPLEFDKLWADHQDQSRHRVETLLVHSKAELLGWWAEEASREHPFADPAEVAVHVLKDPQQTRVVDIVVRAHGIAIERRQVALCEAPNSNHKLHDQVMDFLDFCTGIPVVMRTKGFPATKTSQVAPALRQVELRRGLALQLAPIEWNNLQVARSFLTLHGAAAGFTEWRRERQWLNTWMRPLARLVQVPPPAPGWKKDGPIAGTKEPEPPEPPSGPFPLLIGHDQERTSVVWDPYREAPEHLNNFSFLVTGDAGSGKTQTIRVLIDAAACADLSVCIFDFKNDYADPAFVDALGIRVVDLRTQGLPFNPMEPPPRGPVGVQPVEHAHELASVLGRVFRLGPVQVGHLREGICTAYRGCGVDPQKWVDPASVRWPAFSDALASLDPKQDSAMIAKLTMLVALGLFPSEPIASTFGDLVDGRVCLKLNDLPDDDFKAALAEILIIQLHGHALRGDQPRRLQRLLVFDEAHRVRASARLESLAREGRAFGIGIVIGTQFPGDIRDEMAGNLATQLFLMNNQAEHRNHVVRHIHGTIATPDARRLQAHLGALKPLQGLFTNPHHKEALVDVVPHYQRAPVEPPSPGESRRV
jgi:hypothetical protein